MKFVVMALVITLPSMSTLAQPCNDMDQLQWLVGDWHSQDNKRVIMESWERTSALTYEGMGITLSITGEEISREWLRLLAMENQVFYLAKVDHNSLPTPFQLTHCQDQRLIFQNPQHDFPKVIIYQKQGEEQLRVTITDGNERSSTLEFQKQ